ncbi:hypothetical protein [Streptomyces spiralis]
MVHGPAAGLELLAPPASDKRMASHHRLHAARAHLLERAGDHVAATAAYREAARRATNALERRYLTTKASQRLIR